MAVIRKAGIPHVSPGPTLVFVLQLEAGAPHTCLSSCHCWARNTSAARIWAPPHSMSSVNCFMLLLCQKFPSQTFSVVGSCRVSPLHILTKNSAMLFKPCQPSLHDSIYVFTKPPSSLGRLSIGHPLCVFPCLGVRKTAFFQDSFTFSR